MNKRLEEIFKELHARIGKELMMHPQVLNQFLPPVPASQEARYNEILGIPVVTSSYLPATAPRERLHPDWRRRQARNSALALAGDYRHPPLPLWYTVEEPVVFVVDKRRMNLDLSKITFNLEF